MLDPTRRFARFAGIVAVPLAWLMAAACLQAQGTATQADGKKSRTEEFPVKMSITATAPDADGKQQLTVTLTIAKGKHGYHLHANSTGNSDVEGYETLVKVAGKGLREAKIDYPAGDLVQDKIIGPYRIYQGAVTVKANVRRAIGDREPLVVSAYVFPLDAIGCRWLPRVLKETVR